MKDLIRYDLLVQEALKGVVRKVLGDAVNDGLPGDHHFYVSFRTDFPGVRLSQRLREKYPQDMTIVLQHQFWDLSVGEHSFEVGLSFSGIPERLQIPFDAITGFFDPSVQFGLKFESKREGAEPVPPPSDKVQRPARSLSAEPAGQQPKKGSVPVTAKSAAPRLTAREAKPADEPDKAAPRTAKPERPDKAAKPEAIPPEEKPAEPGAPAEVVNLDAFRKKH
jgi:uncharacterized protein